jgi:hypothetical protein
MQCVDSECAYMILIMMCVWGGRQEVRGDYPQAETLYKRVMCVCVCERERERERKERERKE